MEYFIINRKHFITMKYFIISNMEYFIIIALKLVYSKVKKQYNLLYLLFNILQLNEKKNNYFLKKAKKNF